MLECNDAMVFIDLDQTWSELCTTCIGGQNPAECQPLTPPNVNFTTVLTCQQQCQLNATCNALNWVDYTKSCQLLSCVVNPPSFIGDPNTTFWTYVLLRALCQVGRAQPCCYHVAARLLPGCCLAASVRLLLIVAASAA